MDEVKSLIDFLKIYSPSGKEREAVIFLKDLLNDLGIDSKIDHRGNLLAKIEGNETKVLLCSHIDTVKGKIPIKIYEEYIQARGSVDAKSSLLALIFAAYKIIKKNDHPTIHLACVAGEESEDSGFQYIPSDFLNVDYAIFGEPSNAKGITIGYKGRISFSVEIIDSSLHASSKYCNSIKKASSLILELNKLENKYSSKSLFNSLTINPVKIKAGNSTNVHPKKCEIFFDVRIPPSLSIEEIYNEIKNIIKNKIKNLHFKFKLLSKINPVLINKNDYLVKIFKKSIAKNLKTQPKLILKTGTSDMNYFVEMFEKSCISYGPGDPNIEHTDNEKVSIKEYLKSIDVIAYALQLLNKDLNNARE
jgi:LysW-gamma-L-lysine carboxypeptidase